MYVCLLTITSQLQKHIVQESNVGIECHLLCLLLNETRISEC